MRKSGIRARCRGRFKPMTTLSSGNFEGRNLWRNARVEGSGKVVGSDVTAVSLGTGFAYVAVSLDLCSRKVLGWSISRANDTTLTLSCLRACNGLEPGWIHHSDRGSNYTSHAFLKSIETEGGISSFSRAARPYDNAIVERFFSTLKFEGTPSGTYSDFATLKTRITQFIHSYNTERRHSKLGYISPQQFEATVGQRPTTKKQHACP